MTNELIIDGRGVTTSRARDVVNPATGRPFATAPVCTRGQLDDAFAAAARAQRSWAADPAHRATALHRCADALRDEAETLGPLLVAEQGKPLVEAVREIRAGAIWLSYYAGLQLPRTVIQDDAAAFVEAVGRPIGVVAAITPWNFPILLACWKIGPALSAGNTMVLKPSPFTPLSTLRMVELLNEYLPPGVLNAVTGEDALGEWMTHHPVPRKVSFTGSIATGKRIATAIAPDLKRVTLELGGNDPAVVLDDADPARIADRLFGAAFLNAGQVCCAVKRVYVPHRIRAAVVTELADRAAALRVGDGMVADTQLGPVNNLAQYERVRDLTAAALAQGAVAVTGGRPLDRDGYFYAPTIVDSAVDGMAVVDEEQFGPVLPVIGYDSLDDTVERINASMFGLCASVWGEDEERATDVATRIECGTAWVNTHAANAPHQPFGGFKWSGVGVENGAPGLASFTETQIVHRSRSM